MALQFAALALAGLLQISDSGLAAEQDAASRVYVSCLVRATKAIDDGVSDVTAVARKVADRCIAPFQLMKDAYGRRLNARARQMFSDGVEASRVDNAAKVVLRVRREPSFDVKAPPPPPGAEPIPPAAL